ncbi:transposase [Kineococcus indalonis]|uniref:transposase n=1 Tax=Kineococcus indalonis TaxID=2696566 RepID=UPI002B1BE370|nr:transposase [Kineococcus indalonis]
MDSRSVRSSEGGHGRSCDAGGKVDGRKRMTAVDVEGDLLAVQVTGGAISGTAGGIDLLDELPEQFPDLRQVRCDQGFRRGLTERADALGTTAAVISRRPGSVGFHVLPRRGVLAQPSPRTWNSRSARGGQAQEVPRRIAGVGHDQARRCRHGTRHPHHRARPHPAGCDRGR